MPNITIQNISTAPVQLREWYITLKPGAIYTGFRSADALMSSVDLHGEIAAGRVSFAYVYTADEIGSDFLPFPGMSGGGGGGPTSEVVVGSNKITYGFGIPASGNWVQGDVRFNTTSSPGSNVGWVCTVAGNPGLWTEFGLISA